MGILNTILTYIFTAGIIFAGVANAYELRKNIKHAIYIFFGYLVAAVLFYHWAIA